VRAFLNGGYRSGCLDRINCDGRSPGRQIQREAVGQHQCERIERLRVRVVVIVVRLDVNSGRGVRNGMGEKEMSVNLPGVSVVSVGTGMDVLERRKKESQQKCQACLDSYRATHHLEFIGESRLQPEVIMGRRDEGSGWVILSSVTGQ
jgi:hypothetical protein